MPNKFEEEKEKQGLLLYIATFLMVLAGLFLTVGVSFDFEIPEIVIEEVEDYSEAINLMEQIKKVYNFSRPGPFAFILPFDRDPGRSNPFILGEEIEEETEEDIIIEEEEIEEDIEEEIDNN